MSETTARDRLVLSVLRTHAEQALQVQLAQLDSEGHGVGHRIAGPKHYNLGTTELLSHDLDERDAVEIRDMLNAVVPLTLFELRCGTTEQADTVVAYSVARAARDHGEHCYQQKFGITDDLSWRDEGWDDKRVSRLYARDVDGEETGTDWHVVPVTVPSSYVPEGGAR